MTDLALQLDGVGKTYKGFALRDVCFELPRGYIMGLIGANGAGKTTILKLIMNLIRRDSGRITVFGKDNLRHEAQIKRNIGFVYDVPRFYDDARLTDIARAVAPFYPNWDQGRFDSFTGEFGLPMRKKFKTLSTGMKTQFALSLALSHDAELILMDEPTSGLDPIVRRELLDKLREILQDERKSIVFSTHITSDLERVADFITLLQAGKVVFSSDKDEILENWALVKGDNQLLTDATRAHLEGLARGHHVLYNTAPPRSSMFALIRKDLIACRLFLVIGLAIYVLYAVTSYQRPLGYFVLNIVAIIMLVLTPIIVNDKYRTDTLVCYLPPSRSKVVLARYVMALIALVAGLGLHYGLGAVLSISFEETGFRTLCAPQAVLAFCMVPVAFVSLYFPCFFRFGLGRGALAFAIIMVALAVFITSPLLATDLLWANGGFVVTREMLQHPEMAFVGLIDHVAAAVGSSRFYAAVSIGSVALVSASIAFSVRFFKRRDF